MTDAEVRALIVRANSAGHESLAEYAAALEERLAETEAYAKEGWEWLEESLEAAGWPTVFDIPKRAA